MPFTSFDEIDMSDLLFGNTLRASRLSQLNENMKQALLTPEFFGPADYSNGDTVSIPTSSVDGYTYDRSELFYIWEWREQNADSTGQHYRIPAFYAIIDSVGLVTLQVWRLKNGGPYITEPDAGDATIKLRVTTIGMRGMTPDHDPSFSSNAPTDVSTSTVDNDGSLQGSVNTQSGTAYTFGLEDNGSLVRMTSSSANTPTIPTNASVAFPIGATIQVRQVGTGITTVTAAGGVTLNSISPVLVQNKTVTLTKVNTNEWDLA